MTGATYWFNVPGKPETKGSIRAIPHRQTGRVLLLNDNPRSKAHQKVIADRAREADLPLAPAGTPVEINLTFWLKRPKAHYRVNGRLKDDAPLVPTTKPDVDKLVRLVLDGLTGVAYEDDSQVASVTAAKVYALQGELTSIGISHVSREGGE